MIHLTSSSQKNALRAACQQLESARNTKDKDPKAAFSSCEKASSELAKIRTKTTRDQSVRDQLALIYVELGNLYISLGKGDFAHRAYQRAIKWGHILRTNIVTDSSGPSDADANNSNNDATRSPEKIENFTASRTEPILQQIFVQEVHRLVTKYNLPESDEHITSTPQLMYCLSLISNPGLSAEVIDKSELSEAECTWIQAMLEDADGKERLHALAENMVGQFINNGIRMKSTVAEIVCLAPVLNEELFRRLLMTFINDIEKSVLLEIHLLEGLAQLMDCAGPGYLKADDFVQILGLLNIRLQNIHIQSTDYQYQLTLTVSHVLDAMFDTNVTGLRREKLHDPLSAFLDTLRGSADAYLVYQAAYAYQALQYVPNDESVWQASFRRTGIVAKSALGMVSAVKSLDLKKFFDELDSIQKGLPVTEMIQLVENAYTNVTKLKDSGQSFLKGIQDCFNRKYVWYPTLRGIDTLLKGGQFPEFKALVCNAPCRRDPAFQWGLCQRLGDLADNPLWDVTTRQDAVTLLRDVYCNDAAWGQHPNIKQWILKILIHLKMSQDSTIASYTSAVLQGMEQDGDMSKRHLYQGCLKEGSGTYPITIWDPVRHANQESILLKAVQDRDQRYANVDALPAQFKDIKQEIQSSNSETKQAVDDGFAQSRVDMGQIHADTRIIFESLVSQSSLDEVQDALKKYYTSYLSIQRVSGETLDLETCFVNLAIVEAPAQREKDKQDLKEQAAIFHRIPSFEAVARVNMESPIPLEHLFNKRKLRDGKVDVPKTILVQGRAGIGKTTLCKKLVHIHQTGLWRDRFDAVLWLPLRQLKAFKARNLNDLLREKFFSYEYENERDALVRALEARARDGKVLFILDGLDEIVVDTKTDEGFVLKSFLGNLIKEQHVVITSRPSGLDRSLLPPKIDLELETIGFSQQNVKDFLVKVLSPEAANTVQDFIQRTPLIQGLVNIPVQLDVICFSWDSLPINGHTITMTQLYQLMVRKLWRKDAVQLGKSAEGVILAQEHINQLESEEIDELMAIEIQHLGYIAFKGMMNNHQIEFDEKTLLGALRDLKEYRATVNNGRLPPQLLEMMKRTSFLHTADADLDASKSDTLQTWHFLHLTFQEYFAATWISQYLQDKKPRPAGVMTTEKAITFVRKHKYNPQYEIVWWMVAGLLENEALEEFFDLLQGAPRDLIGGRHQQILASCLNEARARLDTTVVTRLDTELMKWLNFEIQTCHVGDDRSMLGSQNSFPETILVDSLHTTSPWKAILVNTLGAHSALSESAINSLFGALKDEDKDVRSSATSVLGKQSTLPESAIQSLIGALKDENEDVRFSAVEALGNQLTLPESAIQSLIGALKDENYGVRSLVEEVLCNQPTLPKSAIQFLIGALMDENYGVRSFAAETLGNQPTLPESAIQSLINALKDKDKDVRSSATSVLSKQSTLPEPAIHSLIDALMDENYDPLIDALKDKDKDVRSSAISVLSQQSTLPESAIHSLIGALKDGNYDVGPFAAEALGNQPILSESAIQSLIGALKDEDEGIRERAAEALSNQHMLPKSAIESLIDALVDKHDVRYLAATVLKDQPTLPESAIHSLIGGLKNKYCYVRLLAVAVLSGQSTLPESVIHSLVGSLKDENYDAMPLEVEALGNQPILPESAIQSLIGALKDKDEDVRKRAAEALGSQPTLPESAIQSLIDALKDENYGVRKRVADALGKQFTLPELAIEPIIAALLDRPDVRYLAAVVLSEQSTLPESAIHSLIGGLKNKYYYVRLLAVVALSGQSTLPESAIHSLIAALKDGNYIVRSSAVEVLGNQLTLPESAIQSLIGVLKDENYGIRSLVEEALRSQLTLPESAIQSLIGALKDEDNGVRRITAEALSKQSKLPESAIQPLIDALDDADNDVRTRAAEALSKQSTLPESAIQSLVDVLKDEDEDVRERAAEALRKQSTLPESAIQSLVSALKDENYDARPLVAETLGSQPTFPELTIQSLVGALKDEDEDVRKRAAEALGNQPTLPESVIQSLVGALKDADNDIRKGAADVLGNQFTLSGSAIVPFIDAVIDKREARYLAAAVLSDQPTLPESAIHSLVGGLKNKYYYVRLLAVEVLVNQLTLPGSVIQPLIGALKDENYVVRSLAAETLGNQPVLPESTIQSLIDALKDEDEDVRKKAAEALRKQSTLPEPAIQSLINALKGENYDARPLAVKTLGNQPVLPESTIQSIIDALKDEDKDVRKRAAEALNRQPTLPESVIQPLIGALKDENYVVRSLAAEALSKQSTLPESVIQPLIGALVGEDFDIRSSATEVLGKQSTLPESAIQSLIGTLKNESYGVRSSAAETLGNQSMLSELAIHSLVGALKDEHAMVRVSASWVLRSQYYSLCIAFPRLADNEIACVYKNHLFRHSCRHIMSLQVQDDGRLCFYTEEGPVLTEPMESDKMKLIISTFEGVQHEAGI